MRSAILFTTIAFALVLVAFKPFNSKTDKQVCVYGLAYISACDGDAKTAAGWTTEMSDKENYREVKEKIKKQLNDKFPKAVKVDVGASIVDYNEDATNICILKVKSESTNCVTSFYIVAFGTNQPEARRNAEKVAEGNGYKNYEFATQKYWD